MRGARFVAAAVLTVALALVSCGRSKPVGVPEGGAPPVGSACLDRPDDLPRPPTVGLPCELIPPGLAL